MNVVDAQVLEVPGIGGWVVALKFDDTGKQALADASTQLTTLDECGTVEAYPCNAFAIVLDGVVMSAPRFDEPVLGGKAQIGGEYTEQEANAVAAKLKSSLLPVTLDVATEAPTP